jgi:hypothetical protein
MIKLIKIVIYFLQGFILNFLSVGIKDMETRVKIDLKLCELELKIKKLING